jgi:hypothetical protein
MKPIFATGFLIFAFAFCKAQTDTCDVITFIDGSTTHCKVLKKSKAQIKYMPCAMPANVVDTPSKDVFMILRYKGPLEVINSDPAYEKREKDLKDSMAKWNGKIDSLKRATYVRNIKLMDSVYNTNGLERQFNISLGAGVSYGILFVMRNFFNVNEYTSNSTFIVPLSLQGIVDYGVSETSSIGIASSYQVIDRIINYAPSFTVTETISRFNVSARYLYYFKFWDKTKNDYYIGARAGVSFWADKGPLVSPALYIEPYFRQPFFMHFSAQVVAGLRIYFTYFLGLHIEVGIGAPYAVEGGLTFRLGPKKFRR